MSLFMILLNIWSLFLLFQLTKQNWNWPTVTININLDDVDGPYVYSGECSLQEVVSNFDASYVVTDYNDDFITVRVTADSNYVPNNCTDYDYKIYAAMTLNIIEDTTNDDNSVSGGGVCSQATSCYNDALQHVGSYVISKKRTDPIQKQLAIGRTLNL